MPLLPWMPFITQGAASIWNAFTQGKTNRQQRSYEMDMYNRQRQDAIEDFNRQWSLETQYNSPSATMQRYKDAGLNPNLIYGSNQVYNPPAVRSSSAGQWNPKAPQIDGSSLGSTFMNIYDAQMKEAQTDNLKAATKVAEMEAWLKGVQGNNTMADTVLKTGQAPKQQAETEMIQEQVKQFRQMMPLSLEAAAQNLTKGASEIELNLANRQKIDAERVISIARDHREQLMNAMQLQKGSSEIQVNAANVQRALAEIMRIQQLTTNDKKELEKMNEQLSILKKESVMKDLDLGLYKMGIKGTYGDLIRILGKVIQSDWWKDNFIIK